MSHPAVQEKSGMKPMNTARLPISLYLFMSILLLHVLVSFAIGLGFLINPKVVLKTGFNVVYDPNMQILSIVIGMQLLFLGVIALLGIIWTSRKSMYGIYTGAVVGLYMFAFGFVVLMKVGSTDALFVDSIRGFITLIVSYFAYKALKGSNQQVAETE